MTIDVTARLNLPLIAAQQAQKHVTHNEALEALDTLVQATVRDRDLTAPPATSTEGDTYIVAASATGDWAGHDNAIASFRNGGWLFHAPQKGWLVHVADENTFVFFDGTQWLELTTLITVLQNLLKLGINATADDTNRLAVKSDAVLFSHDDASGSGSGDMRLKFNKAASTNTASLLFQDDWSGRAEIGLAGDDDFRFKVSPDGSAWHESIVIDRSSGWVRFPSGGVREVLRADRTYYVDPVAGNDANDGLSWATAFRTINAAVRACYRIDSNGYAVRIKLADGVHDAFLVNRRIVGDARLEIIGNATAPGNVVIRAGGWHATRFEGGCKAALRHVRIETTNNWSLIHMDDASSLHIDGVIFGDALRRAHIEALHNALLTVTGNYTVAGSAKNHLMFRDGAAFGAAAKTVTVTGTPHFSDAFAVFTHGATYDCWHMTWQGAATGKRYDILYNATCNGGRDDHFPGDTPGTTRLGGVYSW